MNPDILARIDAALGVLDTHPYLNHPVAPSWIKLGTGEARQMQAALLGARAEIVRQAALIPKPPVCQQCGHFEGTCACDCDDEPPTDDEPPIMTCAHDWVDGGCGATAPAGTPEWERRIGQRGDVFWLCPKSAAEFPLSEPPTDVSLSQTNTEYALEVGRDDDTEGIYVAATFDEMATPAELLPHVPGSRLVKRDWSVTDWVPVPANELDDDAADDAEAGR